MIDTGIKAERVGDEAALLRSTGDPDRTAPFDFGDLPDYRPDGTRGRRENDSLPRLRLTDFEKPDIRGHSRHAEDAKCCRDGCRRWIQLPQPDAIGKRVFLPTAIAKDDVPNREFWIPRLNNLADRAADHWLPDCRWRRVGLCGAHATTHIWVKREIEDAHENLTFARFRSRPFYEFEIIATG